MSEADRSALIVVDLQRAFIDPDGLLAVKGAVDELRDAGIEVVG